MTGTVHVIGGGIAGISTALCLAEAGVRTIIHEMTDHLGGRCRSYHDPALGRRIDNGTHILVGANAAAFRFLCRVGAEDRVLAVGEDGIPFVDLLTGARWMTRLGGGRFPWSLALPSRRVPGTSLREYLRLAALLRAPVTATVTGVLGGGPLMERLWRPMTEAALNTAPEEAAAALLKPVVRGLLLGGRSAARIYLARESLASTFIEPAVARLAARGVELRHRARLRRIATADGRVTLLGFDDGDVPLAPADRLVLALPHAAVAELLPNVPVPSGHRAIVNVHFLAPEQTHASPPLVGLINGTAHWLCRRGSILSATTSAADGLAARPADAIADAVWSDAQAAMGFQAPLPPFRVVKEHTATFAQTPAEAAKRPGPLTSLGNLILAGDWTATGLPATIDGAAASGETAARAVAALAAEKR